MDFGFTSQSRTALGSWGIICKQRTNKAKLWYLGSCFRFLCLFISLFIWSGHAAPSYRHLDDAERNRKWRHKYRCIWRHQSTWHIKLTIREQKLKCQQKQHLQHTHAASFCQKSLEKRLVSMNNLQFTVIKTHQTCFVSITDAIDINATALKE